MLTTPTMKRRLTPPGAPQPALVHVASTVASLEARLRGRVRVAQVK